MPGRRGNALSQGDLAYRVGVTTSTIQKWEREGFPHADHLALLARELGLTADEIIGHAPMREEDLPPAERDYSLMAKRLTQLREDAGLEQRDIAKRLGVSLRTVKNWESGTTVPNSLSAIATFAHMYDVTMDYILGSVDDPHQYRIGNDVHTRGGATGRDAESVGPAGLAVAKKTLEDLGAEGEETHRPRRAKGKRAEGGEA